MEAETIHCITNASGEKALVIAAKNGNERAFETLVERYRGRIIAIALRFTRVEEDAEDAAQLSFQKAYFRLHTFEGKSSFSTWLTRIAINEALMLRRRARKQRQVSIDEHSIEAETGSAGLEIQDSRPDPEASCAATRAGANFVGSDGEVKTGTAESNRIARTYRVVHGGDGRTPGDFGRRG